MIDHPAPERCLLGLMGVVLLAFSVGTVRSKIAEHRALPAQAEAMTGEALRTAPGPRWVVLTDSRWGEPRVQQADGLNVPIVDAQGRLVALGLVREGDEEVLGDVPWGVAEPLDARRYVARLAERGLDARGVVGLKHLHAGRSPDDHLVDAACAVALALLGAVSALALLPARWLLAIARRLPDPDASPRRQARLGGALLLGLATLMFALLCHRAPSSGLLAFLAPVIVAVAGLGGLALLIVAGWFAPGARDGACSAETGSTPAATPRPPSRGS